MSKLAVIKIVPTEAAMLNLATSCAMVCGNNAIIYLQGDLGAGKTTFARGFLRGLHYTGKVKSPTYTLVESYETYGVKVYHFDLYRLTDPQELEFMGIQDYFTEPALHLIEWPDKGLGFLPSPDLSCSILMAAEGREVNLEAHTPIARNILKQLIALED
jgi:tRNA threonylcarbamoyladenosine biosynthesis protein TsaE